jgi:hypothetical protein
MAPGTGSGSFGASTMKLKDKLAIAAGSAFALSYFLPALGDLPGYGCFAVCWSTLTRGAGDHDLSFGSWAYYSGFVLTNLLFAVLLGANFLAARYARARLWLSAILALHVLSWLVVNLLSIGHEKFNLGFGYFLWLLSFILLFFAHAMAGHAPSPKPAPAPAAPGAGRDPQVNDP